MFEIGPMTVLIALVAAMIGAYCDLRWFRVPNAFTFPLAIAGLLFQAIHPQGSAMDALAGFALGLGILIVPYALGLMGAGDVKLLAALGAWLGVIGVVVVFAVSSLAAGLYALVLIALRGKIADSWLAVKVISLKFATLGMAAGKDDMVGELVRQPDRRLRVIPYGVTLPIGVVGLAVWKFWSLG